MHMGVLQRRPFFFRVGAILMIVMERKKRVTKS